MNWLSILLTATANDGIPARPAQWQESLELMGVGWGSIFIVIILVMICILVLNKIFSKK